MTYSSKKAYLGQICANLIQKFHQPMQKSIETIKKFNKERTKRIIEQKSKQKTY
jgi:hypothetical protein